MSNEAAAEATLRKRSNSNFLLSVFQLKKDNRRKRKTLIDQASEAHIKVLLKVVRLVWSGAIPLKDKCHHANIKRSGKIGHIAQHFLNDESYKSLKTKSLQEQKEVLVKISTWHELLYSLFNKSSRRK